MKTVKIYSLLILFLAIADFSFAQELKTETLNVSGVCGTCKKKIEKAAEEAGATYAVWSTNTKVLTLRYNSLSTNSAKIQMKIAEAGYDTPDFKAPADAYNKLEKCCQYDREAMNKNEKCCSEKCEMKDGKCKDETTCKEKGNCTDMAKYKSMGCCGNEMAANAKMDCTMKGADSKSTMNCKDDTKNCCSKKTQQ